MSSANQSHAVHPPATRILGTGHYLPQRVVTNDELAQRLETSDEWIVRRTGIRRRHIAAPDEAASDLASRAALRALELADVPARAVDLIIVSTVSGDMPMPSTAVFVQRNIGARPDCPGFDLAAACAGFIYGLSVADALIRAGSVRYVLLIGVEVLSRLVDWSDRSSCVLFGDGAGAVLLGPSSKDGRGIASTHLFADGSKIESLCIPGGGSRQPLSESVLRDKQHLVHLRGQDVYRCAVQRLSSATQLALAANQLAPEDLDWVVPHQANLRILESVQAATRIPMERFFINLEGTANTSSASIPIALDQAARSRAIQRGQTVVLCALGGGIAWGSALLRW